MQPINTALLSYGMSGKLFHGPFLQVHKGFDFYACWQRTKNDVHEKYPTVKIYRGIEELLADEAIELVIVNSPSFTHFQYAKQALLAGKNVVVEKPFTATTAEARELIELAAEKKLMLSVYQNRRYDSDYLTVKKIIDEQWLGDIVEAEFHYDRFKEVITPLPLKEQPNAAAGVLYDLGSHIIDQALQLFGLPQSVFGDVRIARKLSMIDDYYEVLLYYPDKRVRLRSSYIVREHLPAYVLHGNKGSFIKAKTDVQEQCLLNGQLPDTDNWGVEPPNEKGLLHTEKNGEIIKRQIDSLLGNYMNFYEGLYQAIRNNHLPPVAPVESLYVIAVIEAAMESSKQKKVVSFKGGFQNSNVE
ncbi:MAG: Gfo/Idh/MocA family oxidoreductase [Bacteroidota bacterium]